MKEKRFVTVYSQELGMSEIIVDTVTRVQYLRTSSAAGGGVTVLVDAQGKPLLAAEPPKPGTWRGTGE